MADDEDPNPDSAPHQSRTSQLLSSIPEASPESSPAAEAPDWDTFIAEYAGGIYDPFRPPPKPVPSPPKASRAPPRIKTISTPILDPSPPSPILNSHIPRPPVQSNRSDIHTSSRRVSRPSMSNRAQSSPTTSSNNVHSLRATPSPNPSTIAQRRGGDAFSLSSHADPPSGPHSIKGGTPAQGLEPPSIKAVADAATVRWAGANVKVGPLLALPSPPAELLDPLAHMTPRSPQADPFSAVHKPSLLSSTDYITYGSSTVTPTDSPSTNPSQPQPVPEVPTATDSIPSPHSNPSSKPRPKAPPFIDSNPPPLPSAPFPVSMSIPSSSSGSIQDVELGADMCAAPLLGSSASYELTMPRKGTVPSQPASATGDQAIFTAVLATSLKGKGKGKEVAIKGPATREAKLFDELGYLVAPYPPNERQRREALHRFNIIGTTSDINFDRIAHLAKLVFSAKWVFISLLDDSKEFLKVADGLSAETVERDQGFCGHTILQEEGMVVLDMQNDWRFKNNPFTRPENLGVKFYAGAPLRTSDGYNIGVLCILDDQPRKEFTSRQRHTLKEFSTIAMRELELWRDKIQLQLRDRIQTSMENFTRECLEMDVPEGGPSLAPDKNMKRVYTRAAQLIKSTLDVNAIIVDISNFEVIRSTEGSHTRNGTPIREYHANLFDGASFSSFSSTSSRTSDPNNDGLPKGNDHANSDDVFPGLYRQEYGPIPPLQIVGAAESGALPPTRNTPLSGEDHAKLARFLSQYPDGKMYERIVPTCFRGVIPTNVQYAMIVPIFNVDQRPFSLLCAYPSDRTKHYLEGYEMQFLRAIGVIILSAVLKRRMMLADQAKSLFISNISHELRTPLHGILAAAELLTETGLSPTQMSFLQTVQACGTSLVETVNHVLDFSKLSGTTRNEGLKHAIRRTSVDLLGLMEETVEGSWIGSRARAVYGAAEIGSAYSPPKKQSTDPASTTAPDKPVVETILDVERRVEGWTLKCEKGGVRRVLMNLIGNSLKFTTDGFIHVTLRELPSEPNAPNVLLELAVIDSGKGISQNFLKNHIFTPFSQENPLQTGTGLGLAIVNSIVKSEGVNGKVDVRSEEGVGTEIRITFEAERLTRPPPIDMVHQEQLPAAHICMIGFDLQKKGQKVLHEVLSSYLTEWWSVNVVDELPSANILIVNEDVGVLQDLVNNMVTLRPVIFLSPSRGDEELSTTLKAFERIGGLCRLVFKPCRPSHLFSAVRESLASLALKSGGGRIFDESFTQRPSPPTQRMSIFSDEEEYQDLVHQVDQSLNIVPETAVPDMIRPSRRKSDEPFPTTRRPALGPRSVTHAPRPTLTPIPSDSKMPTGTVGLPGGDGDSMMLESAKGTVQRTTALRVLIVEDNLINRQLLVHFIKKKYQYEEAEDGQEAVDIFRARPAGYFEVILIDMSMPRLDGVGATQMIRSIERERYGLLTPSPSLHEADRPAPSPDPSQKRAKIFALSGLASSDDRVRAISAGVDGYLVKPVPFATLAAVFSKLENEPS